MPKITYITYFVHIFRLQLERHFVFFSRCFACEYCFHYLKSTHGALRTVLLLGCFLVFKIKSNAKSSASQPNYSVSFLQTFSRHEVLLFLPILQLGDNLSTSHLSDLKTTRVVDKIEQTEAAAAANTVKVNLTTNYNKSLLLHLVKNVCSPVPHLYSKWICRHSPACQVAYYSL